MSKGNAQPVHPPGALLWAHASATLPLPGTLGPSLRKGSHLSYWHYDRETGLHYNRFRYYSPELGRYLESYPIGVEGGLNLYAYTNNSLAHVDVRGLKDQCTPGEESSESSREQEDKVDTEKPKKSFVRVGEVDSFGELKSREKTNDGLEHDHVPAKSAVRKAIEEKIKRPLDSAEVKKLEVYLTAIESPEEVHKNSRTYKGRSKGQQSSMDAKNLKKAAEEDMAHMRDEFIQSSGMSPKEVDEAFKNIHKRNKAIGLYGKSLKKLIEYLEFD